MGDAIGLSLVEKAGQSRVHERKKRCTFKAGSSRPRELMLKKAGRTEERRKFDAVKPTHDLIRGHMRYCTPVVLS